MANSSKAFQNGRIYRILNQVGDECYVGSTCQPLSKRMTGHKAAANTPHTQHHPLYAKMREHGIEDFHIEFVEAYPCGNLEELR